MPRKIIAFIISFCLIFEQAGFAQVAPQLGVPAYLQNLAPVADKFRPIHLRSISLDQSTNDFSLLLDQGDAKSLQQPQVEETTKKLLEYFKIGLTLPNSMFWVNLRPDAPTDIIDPYVEQTDLGRVLLEADLQLKKDMARFTNPNTPEGKQYWDKLYQKAESLYGFNDMEIPTLTRPWIVPGEIIIGESKDQAYIYKATLKVMLEQDYLKDTAFYSFDDERAKELNDYSSQILRELIIPKLTREVNASKRYASLRQVYYSLVLAQWFKQKYAPSLRGMGATTQSSSTAALAQTINSRDLSKLTSATKWSKDTYYQSYKKSFSQGEYNLQETVYSASGMTMRQYFSGGVNFGSSTRADGGVTISAGIPQNGPVLLKLKWLFSETVERLAFDVSNDAVLGKVMRAANHSRREIITDLLDNRLRPEMINAWVQLHPEKFRSMAQFIADGIRASYIDFATFYKGLSSTVQDFNTRCTDDYIVLIPGGTVKSTDWTFRLAQKLGMRKPKVTVQISDTMISQGALLLNKGKDWFSRFAQKFGMRAPSSTVQISDGLLPQEVRLLEKALKSNPTLPVVIVDDACYSGVRLARWFDSIPHELTRGMEVHLVVPFMTLEAERLIRDILRNKDIRLIIHTHATIKSLYDLLNEVEDEEKRKALLAAIYEYYDIKPWDARSLEEKTLTYLQHKVPEGPGALYPKTEHAEEGANVYSLLVPETLPPYRPEYKYWIRKAQSRFFDRALPGQLLDTVPLAQKDGGNGDEKNKQTKTGRGELSSVLKKAVAYATTEGNRSDVFMNEREQSPADPVLIVAQYFYKNISAQKIVEELQAAGVGISDKDKDNFINDLQAAGLKRLNERRDMPHVGEAAAYTGFIIGVAPMGYLAEFLKNFKYAGEERMISFRYPAPGGGSLKIIVPASVLAKRTAWLDGMRDAERVGKWKYRKDGDTIRIVDYHPLPSLTFDSPYMVWDEKVNGKYVNRREGSLMKLEPVLDKLFKQQGIENIDWSEHKEDMPAIRQKEIFDLKNQDYIPDELMIQLTAKIDGKEYAVYSDALAAEIKDLLERSEKEGARGVAGERGEIDDHSHFIGTDFEGPSPTEAGAEKLSSVYIPTRPGELILYGLAPEMRSDMSYLVYRVSDTESANEELDSRKENPFNNPKILALKEKLEADPRHRGGGENAAQKDGGNGDDSSKKDLLEHLAQQEKPQQKSPDPAELVQLNEQPEMTKDLNEILYTVPQSLVKQLMDAPDVTQAMKDELEAEYNKLLAELSSLPEDVRSQQTAALNDMKDLLNAALDNPQETQRLTALLRCMVLWVNDLREQKKSFHFVNLARDAATFHLIGEIENKRKSIEEEKTNNEGTSAKSRVLRLLGKVVSSGKALKSWVAYYSRDRISGESHKEPGKESGTVSDYMTAMLIDLRYAMREVQDTYRADNKGSLQRYIDEEKANGVDEAEAGKRAQERLNQEAKDYAATQFYPRMREKMKTGFYSNEKFAKMVKLVRAEFLKDLREQGYDGKGNILLIDNGIRGTIPFFLKFCLDFEEKEDGKWDFKSDKDLKDKDGNEKVQVAMIEVSHEYVGLESIIDLFSPLKLTRLSPDDLLLKDNDAFKEMFKPGHGIGIRIEEVIGSHPVYFDLDDMNIHRVNNKAQLLAFFFLKLMAINAVLEMKKENASILSGKPLIDSGELSKKIAEITNNLPEEGRVSHKDGGVTELIDDWKLKIKGAYRFDGWFTEPPRDIDGWLKLHERIERDIAAFVEAMPVEVMDQKQDTINNVSLGLGAAVVEMIKNGADGNAAEYDDNFKGKKPLAEHFVIVEVDRTATDLIITVRDSGYGKEMAGVDKNRSFVYTGGAGIGASMCKEIAAFNNGVFNLDTETPGNVRATIQIPLEKLVPKDGGTTAFLQEYLLKAKSMEKDVLGTLTEADSLPGTLFYRRVKIPLSGSIHGELGDVSYSFFAKDFCEDITNDLLEDLENNGYHSIVSRLLNEKDEQSYYKNFHAVVREAWTNALDSIKELGSSEGLIEIGARAHDGILEIFVRDNGTGMQNTSEAEDFAPGVSTKGEGHEHDGLYHSREFVEKVLHGTMRLQNNANKEDVFGHGAQLIITIPLQAKDGGLYETLSPAFADAKQALDRIKSDYVDIKASLEGTTRAAETSRYRFYIEEALGKVEKRLDDWLNKNPDVWEPAPKSFSVEDVVKDAVGKKERIKLQVQGNLDFIITSHPAVLKEIVDNIITNAEKYSGANEAVTVTISRLPDGYIIIAISDNGKGMGEEFLKILDRAKDVSELPEYTSPTVLSRTALGLPIVFDRTYNDLGGTIEVISTTAGTEGQKPYITFRRDENGNVSEIDSADHTGTTYYVRLQDEIYQHLHPTASSIASSIRHDVNNAMTSFEGYLDLIADDLPEKEREDVMNLAARGRGLAATLTAGTKEEQENSSPTRIDTNKDGGVILDQRLWAGMSDRDATARRWAASKPEQDNPKIAVSDLERYKFYMGLDPELLGLLPQADIADFMKLKQQFGTRRNDNQARDGGNINIGEIILDQGQVWVYEPITSLNKDNKEFKRLARIHSMPLGGAKKRNLIWFDSRLLKENGYNKLMDKELIEKFAHISSPEIKNILRIEEKQTFGDFMDDNFVVIDDRLVSMTKEGKFYFDAIGDSNKKAIEQVFGLDHAKSKYTYDNAVKRNVMARYLLDNLPAVKATASRGQQTLNDFKDGGTVPANPDKGGIDFRALPIQTRPVEAIGAAGAMNIPVVVDPQIAAALDNEWAQIAQQMQKGPMPYAKMKEYAADCKAKGATQQMDAMFICIAEILRMEEDRAVETPKELKEILTTIG